MVLTKEFFGKIEEKFQIFGERCSYVTVPDTGVSGCLCPLCQKNCDTSRIEELGSGSCAALGILN